MTASPETALVREAIRRGVRLVWDPPRFRGPDAAMGLLQQIPDTARELLRRATAYREQLDAWARPGRVGVPLLVLPGAPAPHAGACISCAVAIPEGRWRCELCLRAIELVLGLAPVDMDS